MERWAHNGRVARFWLRDDDAVDPTPALDRLINLSDRYRVPVALAVIPESTGQELALHLSGKNLVTVAVHGWSHESHAAPGRKKQELGPERPLATVLRQLETGLSKLETLYGRQLSPVLVPPWNRIDQDIRVELRKSGFRALSVFGTAKTEPGEIPCINTHVDLMDWHGTRGCRPHGDLVADIVTQMKQRFDNDDEPIGILAHHLVHDDAAWAFLNALFEITTTKPGIAWKNLPDLLS
ncbi:polysaccharide deacetylase family protein [Ochrobactrum daejeonense]|nr:polysaccharide deacetylase family protein [Brucella daejeonensis]